jgi:hypothetical protein
MILASFTFILGLVYLLAVIFPKSRFSRFLYGKRWISYWSVENKNRSRIGGLLHSTGFILLGIFFASSGSQSLPWYFMPITVACMLVGSIIMLRI